MRLVEVVKDVGLITCGRSEFCQRARLLGGDVGHVCLGVVHMEGGVQVRVQVEVGREEQGEGETHGESQNEFSNEKQSTAHHGWHGDEVTRACRPLSLEPCGVIHIIRRVQCAWEKWRVKCICIHSALTYFLLQSPLHLCLLLPIASSSSTCEQSQLWPKCWHAWFLGQTAAWTSVNTTRHLYLPNHIAAYSSWCRHLHPMTQWTQSSHTCSCKRVMENCAFLSRKQHVSMDWICQKIATSNTRKPVVSEYPILWNKKCVKTYCFSTFLKQAISKFVRSNGLDMALFDNETHFFKLFSWSFLTQTCFSWRHPVRLETLPLTSKMSRTARTRAPQMRPKNDIQTHKFNSKRKYPIHWNTLCASYSRTHWGNLIEPKWLRHVAFPFTWKQYSYFTEDAHSIWSQSWRRRSLQGAKESREGRQTVFFTLLDPWGHVEPKKGTPQDCVGTRSRRRLLDPSGQGTGKRHNILQIKSHAIIAYNMVPLDCIERVIPQKGATT